MQLIKLKIHKTYSYEPGKTSPLPPIPSQHEGNEEKNEVENKPDDCEKKVEETITTKGNPNEFHEEDNEIKCTGPIVL